MPPPTKDLRDQCPQDHQAPPTRVCSHPRASGDIMLPRSASGCVEEGSSCTACIARLLSPTLGRGRGQKEDTVQDRGSHARFERRFTLCFGCSETDVPARQAIISHFPALCGHDLRLGSPPTKNSSNLWENGEGPSSPGHVGGGGRGGPSAPGVTVSSKQTASGTRRRGGLSVPEQAGSRESWQHCYLFLQVGNGKPGILTWPSTVGGEDTERRGIPGPDWEDLGPPPQEASSLK